MNEWEAPITLDKETNTRKVQETIARILIRHHGDRAHLEALEEMLKDNADQENWRVILDLIDEINKEGKD